MRRAGVTAILAAMDARSVERAEAQLHELKLQSLEDFLLAAVAFAVALIGTRLLPAMSVPLLVGGMGVAFLGMRALVRRYLLLEDLAVDRDAYLIPEVRAIAARTASREHRLRLTSDVRQALSPASSEASPRIAANRDLLVELEAALQDEALALDPAAAVALDRLLTAGEDNLYSPTLPADELRSRLRRILDAFAARPAAQ
jgi:hypothetical protein